MQPNPYEASREAGPNALAASRANRGASVVWFLPTATLGNALVVLSTPGNLPRTWTLRELAGSSIAVTVMAIAVAIIALFAYGLLGMPFKRRINATRVSRMAAGAASSMAMGLAMQFWLFIRGREIYSGPPGVLTLPAGALAAVITDRLVAKFMMSNGKPTSETGGARLINESQASD